MKNELFDQLMRSAGQMSKIIKEEELPSRAFVFDLPPSSTLDLEYLRRAEMLEQHRGSAPMILIDSENSLPSLKELADRWDRIQREMAKLYSTNMYLEQTAVHLRGRFLHQHKGRRRRQHPIKSEYVKNRYMFRNCYITGSDIMQVCADDVTNLKAIFNYEKWGEKDGSQG